MFLLCWMYKLIRLSPFLWAGPFCIAHHPNEGKANGAQNRQHQAKRSLSFHTYTVKNVFILRTHLSLQILILSLTPFFYFSYKMQYIFRMSPWRNLLEEFPAGSLAYCQNDVCDVRRCRPATQAKVDLFNSFFFFFFATYSQSVKTTAKDNDIA